MLNFMRSPDLRKATTNSTLQIKSSATKTFTKRNKEVCGSVNRTMYSNLVSLFPPKTGMHKPWLQASFLKAGLTTGFLHVYKWERVDNPNTKGEILNAKPKDVSIF